MRESSPYHSLRRQRRDHLYLAYPRTSYVYIRGTAAGGRTLHLDVLTDKVPTIVYRVFGACQLEVIHAHAQHEFVLFVPEAGRPCLSMGLNPA